MKTLRLEICRACSRKVILASSITVCIMLLSGLPNTFSIYSEKLLMRSVLFSMFDKGPLYQFAILLASIPYMTSWIDDKQSGAAKIMISRSGYSCFCRNRFIANMLVGSGSVFIGEIVALLYTVYFFPTLDINLGFFEMSDPFQNIYEYTPILYYLLYYLLGFIMHSAWISLGLAFSTTFFVNKYIVLLLPFAIYNGVVYLADMKIVASAYCMGISSGTDIASSTLLYICIIIVSYFCFMRGVKRYDAS